LPSAREPQYALVVGQSHDTDLYSNVNFTCPDCNENHPPLDYNCSIFQKYKIVNYIMAYYDINQYMQKNWLKSEILLVVNK